MPSGPQLVKGPSAVVVGVMTGLLAIGAGGFGAWWSTERRALASAAGSFPGVPARVLSIRFQEHRGDGTEAPVYSPVVRYAFDLGGHRHESDQFAMWAPRFPTPEEARAFLDGAGIRVDETVTAYVDPKDPTRSVLSKEAPGHVKMGMWAMTAGGLGFVGAGAWLIAGLALSARFRALVMGRRSPVTRHGAVDSHAHDRTP